MKKFVAVLVVLLLSVGLCIPAFAAEPQEIVVSREVQRIDETSYIIITVTESPALTFAAPYSKTGHKNYEYVLHGVLQWTFRVQGVFTVDPGRSCVCTNSGYGFTPHVTTWSLSSADSSYSGNTATATGTVTGEKTVYPSVSLSCDANGNLS